MYAQMHSPYGSPVMCTGGGGGGGAMVMQEIQQLKTMPLLNPNFGMVEKYVDCLNRLMDTLVMTHGAEGYRAWLGEVQVFTRQLQKRMLSGMPLQPQERQIVLNFAAYWRQSTNPAFAMSSPEAQLVLIALTEAASY